MSVKLQTTFLKLFILLLLLQRMQMQFIPYVPDPDMDYMATIPQPRLNDVYLNADTPFSVQNMYTSWGSLSITIVTPSQTLPAVQLNVGNTQSWTATEDGTYKVKAQSNSGMPPSYTIKVIRDGYEQFFYGYAHNTACLINKMYVMNQCVIQIDLFVYLPPATSTVKIHYFPQGGDENTVGVQKLSVTTPNSRANLTLNASSSYYFTVCDSAGIHTRFFAPIKHRIGSECTYSFPTCGNGVLEQPQQCDTGLSPGCSKCVPEIDFDCFTFNDLTSSCLYAPPPLVCGNNIRQTGEQCDNGNQAGCTNCTVDQGYICQLSGRGNVCTLKTGNQPASTTPTVSADVLDNMMKQLQTIIPVTFVILVFVGIILISNIVQQFLNLRQNNSLERTHQDQTTAKKITGKFESHEVIQVKPYQ